MCCFDGTAAAVIRCAKPARHYTLGRSPIPTAPRHHRPVLERGTQQLASIFTSHSCYSPRPVVPFARPEVAAKSAGERGHLGDFVSPALPGDRDTEQDPRRFKPRGREGSKKMHLSLLSSSLMPSIPASPPSIVDPDNFHPPTSPHPSAWRRRRRTAATESADDFP